MWRKLNKLSEPVTARVSMEIVREDGTISNDVKEILERWHRDISKLFSGLRDNPDIVFDEMFYQDILAKKEEFDNLSSEEQISRGKMHHVTVDSLSDLNAPLSLKEVSDAIGKAKLNKAFLDIPNEILKNENAKLLLHSFFKHCFKNSISPSGWSFSDIKPIPKKEKDQRDPLQNRCITIMCCVSKVYSSILNARLQKLNAGWSSF